MKILDRYILKSFIPSFLWCLSIFLFLYVIIDLFGHIDEIIREKIALHLLLYYYATFVPLIFVQTSPMAILLATVYNLSSWNKNNELTAMKASGISIWKILKPILLVGFIVSVFTFIVNDKIVPKSTTLSVRIKEELIEKKTAVPEKTIENLAIYGKKNRIIYARVFDGAKNELKDVIIHEHDANQNLVSKISASKARYRNDRWYFFEVLTSKVNNQGQLIGNPRFYPERVIDIEERPRDFARREWRTELMDYRELSRYINLFKGGAKKTLNRLRVELYQKISFPLTSVVIILVGAPFAMHLRRGGMLAGVGVSIIISLLYYACFAISLAFGKASILPPIIAAWLGNIIFGIYGFNQIQKLR